MTHIAHGLLHHVPDYNGTNRGQARLGALKHTYNDSPPGFGRDIEYCADCQTLTSVKNCHWHIFVASNGVCITYKENIIKNYNRDYKHSASKSEPKFITDTLYWSDHDNAEITTKGGGGIWYGPNSRYNKSYPLPSTGVWTTERAELRAAIDAISTTYEILENTPDHVVIHPRPRSWSLGKGDRAVRSVRQTRRPMGRRCIELLTSSEYVYNMFHRELPRWDVTECKDGEGGPIVNEDLCGRSLRGESSENITMSFASAFI